MEALAAVGLASKVVQLVQFSVDNVSKCTELSRSTQGSTIEYEYLEASAGAISDLCRDVQGSMVAVSRDSLGPRSKDDAILDQLAGDCIKTSKELTVVHERLKVKGTMGSKREILKQSLKARWKRENINEISSRLSHHRNTFNTCILTQLRLVFRADTLYSLFTTHRSCVAAIQQQQNECLPQLEINVEQLLNLVQDGQDVFAKSSDLANVVSDLKRDFWELERSEHIATRSYISQELKTQFELQWRNTLQTQTINAERHQKRLRECLNFPQIHSRQDHIEEAHAKTFDWAFKASSHDKSP